jgi:MFS family permease
MWLRDGARRREEHNSLLPVRVQSTERLVSSGRPPGWWPSRFYYGWALVGVLGITATISYGILSYALGVFIGPMGDELGWSNSAITGAFSLASMVAGLAALPVGRWVDHHGARGVMTAGSVLATMLLVWWAEVRTLPAFYTLWALMGVASAAVLYEPAFAVVAWWFQANRGRALTVLTFLGGFASVIFVPLTTWLVAAHSWREALLWLAAIYAATTIPLHGLLLRRRPRDLGLEPDGGPSTASPVAGRVTTPSFELSVPAEIAVRGREFRWLALGFALSTLATTAVSVHLVPLLLQRGFSLAFAGGAMGLLGLMALPGRLIFTPLGSRWSRATVTASIFALQAAACATLVASRQPAAVWLFVALFGAGFGAITPARAALLAELYGPASYGRISGVLALILAIARAAAPVGASLVYAAGGSGAVGYDRLMVLLFVLSVGSAGAVLATRRSESAMAVPAASATLADLTVGGPVLNSQNDCSIRV